MEHQKNKRGREYDDFDEAENKRVMSSFENNNKKGKKRVEEKGYLALGVFDFPWLKDGTVIFKYEDLFMNFEDNFLSSLEGNNKDTFFNVTSGFDFFEEYGLCEVSMENISEAKLVEDVWKPFESNGVELEAEELDCIWSSLLNKPLFDMNNNNIG